MYYFFENVTSTFFLSFFLSLNVEMSENIVKCSEFVYTREYRYTKVIYYYYYVMKDSPYEEPRKTTQGQRPVSPTGPGMRINTRYMNSTKGTG